MLITTRTHQVPGWSTARGELKICRQPRTHTAFGHVTTDPPPGASLGAYCIVKMLSLNKIGQAILESRVWTFPKFGPSLSPPTFGHVTQDLTLLLVSHMVRY